MAATSFPQPLTLTITLLLLLLLLLFPAGHGSPYPVSALFALGDSSVNCGDNSFLYPFLSSNSSSFLCNSTAPRLLIPDLLAEKLALAEVPTFYGQNGTVEGLMGGLNLGSSPATILKWGWLGFQGLNQQARQLFETLQLLQLRLGLDQAQLLVHSSSLFYISLGMDDLIHLQADPSAVTHRMSRRQFAKLLADQMTRVVKDLYDANARRIVCLGIGPLGCAPRFLWEYFNSSAGRMGCVDRINLLAVDYNSILSSNLRQFSLEKRDVQVLFCDVYSGLMEIIHRPQLYGFGDVNDACCGMGRYGGMVGCVSKEMMCEEQSRHVWWDLYNPTEAVNRHLAQWMWSGTHPKSICWPFGIQELVTSVPLSSTSFQAA